MRECPYSTKTRELLGNPSPLPSRFPTTIEISLGLRPREISRVSGNLLGVGDGFPNTSLVLVEHGYNLHHSKLEVYSDIQMEAINVQHLWFSATVAASRSLPTVDKLHCPVSFNTFLKVNSCQSFRKPKLLAL